MMTIEKDRVVSLRYTMKDDKGNLLEDLMGRDPTEFLYGSGQILPELETRLKGMQAGAEADLSFALAFGAAKKTFHFHVVVVSVRPATTNELQAGKPAQKTAEAGNCGPDCNC